MDLQLQLVDSLVDLPYGDGFWEALLHVNFLVRLFVELIR